MHLAPELIHRAAKHLREPEVNRRPDTHGGAGEEHVVEVGHDEVGVVDEDVDGRGCHEDARQAADDEHRHEREREEHRRGELNPSAPDGAQPVECLHGAGQGDHHRRHHERDAEGRVHARHEHVMAPHDEAQPGDAGDRVDHRPVAEQRLPGERGEDVRHHAHRRQDHDVDGRVAVEPEEVLPEQGLAAAGAGDPVVDHVALGREEPGAEHAVGDLHKAGGRQHGQGERLQDGGDEHGPDRHRQAEHRHAGSPHQDDRRHVVDAAEHARDAHHRQAEQPERLAHAHAGRRIHVGGEGRIARPAARGGATLDEKAPAEEKERRPHEPVREHVERWERHVVGTDHQRNQEVAEGAGEDRDDHQEDHHARVHREEHRVELGRHLTALLGEQLAEHRHVGPRPGDLPADGEGQQAANQEPQQRGEEELQPDHLVVFREDVG